MADSSGKQIEKSDFFSDPKSASSATQMGTYSCAHKGAVGFINEDRTNPHFDPSIRNGDIYLVEGDRRTEENCKNLGPTEETSDLKTKNKKKTACERERIRSHELNKAFDRLRSLLPRSVVSGTAPGKKLSKIETISLAIHHIQYLENRPSNPGPSYPVGDKVYDSHPHQPGPSQLHNFPSSSNGGHFMLPNMGPLSGMNPLSFHSTCHPPSSSPSVDVSWCNNNCIDCPSNSWTPPGGHQGFHVNQNAGGSAGYNSPGYSHYSTGHFPNSSSY